MLMKTPRFLKYPTIWLSRLIKIHQISIAVVITDCPTMIFLF